MKRAVRRLIENRDVEGLANALRENGWSDDEPEFQEVLKILRRMRP